jgi:hypothetical protein
VSILGGIQPGKLQRWARGALQHNVQEDGLIQRLQLFVWPDSLPPWTKVRRFPDPSAKDRAYAVYSRLVSLEGPSEFIFSADAQALFDEWRARLEPRVRSNELSACPAFASHISKYRSLVPSLALIFHLIVLVDAEESADKTDATQDSDGSVSSGSSGSDITFDFSCLVGIDALRLAIAWCDFLEAYAKKLYAAELLPGVDEAHALAAKIKGGAVHDGMPIRDIYRKGWPGLNSQDSVMAAIDVLVAAGWVRVETRPSTSSGGAPGNYLRLHPDLRPN